MVTCVKLKYVQQPVGKRASSSDSIIRPSRRIIYDTREAVVTFLSEDVDKCVAEFLEEWAKVSKMVNVECASELAARTGAFTELLSRCGRWIPKLCGPMLRESPPGRPYTSN